MTDAPYQPPDPGPFEVVLIGPSWRSGPVRLAIGLRARLRGLRPRPAAAGLLLRTGSVHTIGMKFPLWAVTLSESGRVRRVVMMRPGRLLADLGARWVLELPIGHPPPRPGWRLRVVPILAVCPES